MDRVSPHVRSKNMRAIRSKNTATEMAVRQLIHGMGYRYRIHYERLPGRPDLAFPSRKKVIFVHGCFWHQHEGCHEAYIPASNTDYWIPKLKRNQERDMKNLMSLRELGWYCLTIWECQITDTQALATLIREFLEG